MCCDVFLWTVDHVSQNNKHPSKGKLQRGDGSYDLQAGNIRASSRIRHATISYVFDLFDRTMRLRLVLVYVWGWRVGVSVTEHHETRGREIYSF